MSEELGKWVPALVLESNTTPRQRARNYALYLRLRDGIPTGERKSSRDGVGLHVFGFEIPTSSVTAGFRGDEHTLSFRLDKDGECYRRLLSYITDHFFDDCDADVEADRLRAECERLRAIAAEACGIAADWMRDVPLSPLDDSERAEFDRDEARVQELTAALAERSR